MSVINQNNPIDDSDELIFAPEIDTATTEEKDEELIFAPEANQVKLTDEATKNKQLYIESSQNYKLLVVDDEPAIHDITKLLLNDFNFEGKKLEIISAFSGKEALKPMHDYLDDIFSLIEVYQEEYPNPSEKVQDEIEEIDLDYLRKDMQNLIYSMKEGVSRIKEISKSLTTFSRGDLSNKVPCDIHEGLESTILILQHRLKANPDRPEIKIIKEYSQIPPIECYPGQLNQVFMNLLANAIDALEESNQGLSFKDIENKTNLIKIKTEAKENNIIIKITDNGNGMSPETLQKAFNYLFTTKPVGKGTGLGLSICHQIIEEKHHGKLACGSEIGKGTTFIIEIPG